MLVIKIPLSAGSMKDKDGLDEAPNLIEETVKNFHLKEEGVLPVFEFDEIKVDNSNLDGSHKLIQKKVAAIKQPAVLLGGDHSITLPAFTGFASGKSNPGLIVFDAHFDLMDGFNTHEDYLRVLCENGLKNVIIIGVRNFEPRELKYAKDKNIKYFLMKDIDEHTCDAIMETASSWSDVYLSIDVDVLDPAFAPGVSYPEPGGMTTRELLYFIQRLKHLKSLKMVDIVEAKDDSVTAKVAAKVLVELS